MRLKHLLTVALMAVAGSVWAALTPEEVVNENFNDGTTVLFTGVNRVTVANDNNVKFTTAGNSTNGYSNATYNFDTSGSAAVKVEFDYWINNNSCNYDVAFLIRDKDVTAGHARNNMGLDGAFITIGRTRQSSANYFSINRGKTISASASNLGLWCHAEVYIDLVTKKVDYTVSDLTSGDVIKSETGINFLSANAASVSQIEFYGCVNNESDYLDNLVVTKYTTGEALYDYTVQYVCDGEEIKPSTSGQAVEGTVVTVSHDNIWVDDVKYIYVSDDAETETVSKDGNTVVTVTYRKAGEFNYSVVSTLNQTLASGVCVEGENITVPVARYVNVDGTLYETAKNGNDWYRHTYTITEEGQQETIVYNATNLTNIILYSEAEDLDGAISGNGNVTRTSMGLTGYGTDLPVATLPAGSYKIYLHGANGNSSERAVAFKNGETVLAQFVLAKQNNNQDYISGVFTLIEEADITLTSDGSSASGVDYFFIEKSAEAVMAVGEACWATFVAPFEVDVPAGVKAYTVDAVEGSTLTLTEVKGTLAANTPVVLEGELEPTTFSDFAVAGDSHFGLLYGVYAETKAPVESYVLQNHDGVVGFYYVAPGDEPTVPANRAFLSTDGMFGRVLTFGEETAIKTIDALTTGKAEIYDLNGRQLSRLQKGINIVNGAKVLVK